MSFVLIGILWCTAVAGWVLPGMLATGADGARLALLPPVWQLAAALVLATVIALSGRLRTAHVLPLSLSGVLVVPWLPVPVPPAFFGLVGPAAGLAALGIAAAAAAANLPPRFTLRAAPALLSDPRRATMAAGAAAAVIFGLAAWRAAPMVPGGDEPHYLVTTQSLLYDRNLRVETNYARGDHREFFEAELRPHYLRRGQDGEIYSVHLPGLSALVLPAFALGGYPAVVLFLVLLAAAGTGLAWRLSWELTRSPAAAWFGWAAVTTSAPVVFQAFSVYPDGPAAVLVLAGLLAWWRASEGPATERGETARWLAAGAVLAGLPWLHSRLAVLAGLLGALILWRLLQRPGAARNVAAFASLPVLGAAGWFGYFYTIYGELGPAAPYGALSMSAPAYMPSGIGGLFFDHQFGLLPNAPAYLVSLLGLGVMLRGSGEDRTGRWMAAVLALLLVSYVLTISPMRMWWAGSSAPARFLVPLLPALAVPAAAAWHAARCSTTRAVMATALGASMTLTALLVFVQRGRLAYNVRDTYGLLVEWLSPLVVLADGLPSFHRLPEHHGFLHAAVWLGALLAAWLITRRLELSGVLRSRAAIATVVPLSLGAAALTAGTVVWAMTGSPVLRPAPAQLELLRRVEPESRDLALTYAPFRRVAPGELPSLLRIRPAAQWMGGRDAPLFVLPGGLPAGEYRLEVTVTPDGEGEDRGGRLALGIGREWFPLHGFLLSGEAIQTFVFSAPVDLRAVVLHGDAAAETSVAEVALVPVSVQPRRMRPAAEYARQAVAYPGGDVYFLDEGAFVEAPAFWVRGGRTAELVVVPRRPGGVLRLTVRNAPVDNLVTFRSGDWTLDLHLHPGEVRDIEVPLRLPPAPPSTVRISAADGFRPSEVEPGSEDHRWLGVWVALP